MSVLNEIATYIAAQSTATFSAGPHATKTEIWIGRFPEDQRATAIALFEPGGAPPVYSFGSSPMLERPSIQVISRSTSYATARANAKTIYTILAAVEGATLTSTVYTRITPSQSPIDMGQDADDRHLISCNFIAEKEVS